MELVLELSFKQEQMWCAVPKLQTLADALRLDKSGASRAVRSLVMKGALVEQRYKGEILFHFATHADVIKRKLPSRGRVTDAQATAARARLIAINQVRDNGRADAMIDPNGFHQPRLDARMGADQHEDAGVELAALGAMLEEAADSRQVVKRVEDNVPVVPMQNRRMEPFAVGGLLKSDRVISCRRGLDDNKSFVWDLLVSQIQRGNSSAQAEFVKYAPLWRKRLMEYPYAVCEAATDHKLRVRGPADRPGAWIYSRFKRSIREQLTLDKAE